MYAGLYCVGCEAFKTEDELVDGKCPDHDTVPEWIEEKNYFFRLSKYQDQLLELYESRPDYVQPAFRFNEVKSFVSGGLRDFSISRAGQPWGIPLPWDESQVAYVWADALVNYLSALTYARPGEDLRDTFWPEVRHVMAQDIIRFHCVYWPAMLLAAGYDVPKQLFIHGYLTLDDRKISKSLGNSIDPLDVIDVYGADPLRFWCARAVPFGQDGNASLAGIAERYESELGNDLGNLLSRTTAMVVKYRDGRLPGGPGRLVGDRGGDRGRAARERRHRHVRHHRRARPDLVARPRASTGTSRRRSRGSSRRTRRTPTQLDQVLYDLVRRAAGRRRSHSSRTCPRPRRRSSTRSASRRSSAGTRSRTGSSSRAIRSRRRRRSSRASSCRTPTRRDRRAMIDTHAHLGDDAAEVLARARDAGVTSVIDVATSLAGARRSLARAEATDDVHCVLGIHPHEAASFDLAALDELQRAARAPARGRGRRDRSRLLPRLRAAGRAAEALRRPARARVRRPANPSSSTPARPTTTPALACSRTTAL